MTGRDTSFPDSVVALSGGVGGARMADGLARALTDEKRLSIIVNTADDFSHLGLFISPDVDTVLYTLAGLENPETGWGRADETWSFMGALTQLGGEDWFRLGDKDLALHAIRSRGLADGMPLEAVIDRLRQRLGVAADVLPMSNERVQTMVETDKGMVGFQDYFVRQRCAPKVKGFAFVGASEARPPARLLERLADPRLGAIVIGPSNPLVSIAPILAVPGLRAALEASPAPVVAVSPLVGGRAVKGPAAKMIAELGQVPSISWIAEFYSGLIDGLVVDEIDRDAAAQIRGPRVHVTQTIMRDDDAREKLAADVLAFARDIRS